MTYISFPGIGINEFSVNSVAFEIGPFSVRWYGIIITVGIILAFLYLNYRGKKFEGLTDDDVFDYAIAGVVFGIIGARIYYVATEFGRFKADTFWKTLKNIVAIWNGGLGFYGGLILGLLSVVVISLFKKKNPFKVFDACSLGVMIAQVCGRWGNFMNGEAHGGETSLPWAMGLRSSLDETVTYYHPTFFYESLWNLVGFLIINATYKHKKYDGQIVLRYISWYGFGRMFIEGLRTDSLYVGQFRISQVVGFLCFFFGSATLIALDIVHANRRKAALLREAVSDEKTEEIAETAEKSDVSAETAPETAETAEETENAEEGFDIRQLHAEDGKDEDN